MITAYQVAQLEAATVLHDTRNKLLDIRSSIAFEGGQGVIIDDIVLRLDALFATVIPK